MPEDWRDAERRRAYFEQLAEAYHRFRPRYPKAMYEDLVRLARLPPDALVVEVGSGTGIATGPLVERGYRVTCVEPSEPLSAICRAEHGDSVTVVTSTFEHFETPAGVADLVFAANAWHWVEPTRGFATAARLLRPGGSLALAWQLLVRLGPGDFPERVADLYDHLAPELADAWRFQATVEEGWAESMSEAGFCEPARVGHRFRRSFDASTFVELTFTYGSHVALAEGPGCTLRAALTRLIDEEYGGEVFKDEEAVLLVSRWRGESR